MNSEFKKAAKDEKEMFKERMRAEWATLKAMKGAERRAHIATYYKFHIIIVSAVLIVAVSMVVNVLRGEEEHFITIAFVAPSALVAEFQMEALADAITQALGEETSARARVEPFLLTGMAESDFATLSRLNAMAAAADFDLMINSFPPEHEQFEWMVDIEPFWGFVNIRPILAAAGIETERVIYFDTGVGAPEPRAVYLGESVLFEQLGIFTELLYLGVMANASRPQTVPAVLDFIWHGGYS